MNMMATIKDIVKDAGVSISTVSHVINKTRYVSPELVKRVEDALRQAGTPPNFVIKKLRAERDAVTNRFIALFYAEERAFFAELKEKMSRQNLALLMVNYRNTAELLAMNDLLASPACAAILVCPGTFPEKVAQLLRTIPRPRLQSASRLKAPISRWIWILSVPHAGQSAIWSEAATRTSSFFQTR